MTKASSSEQVIRRLYQITHGHKHDFAQQVNQLIQLGLERFQLDIGILSQIEGQEYRVQYCIVPEDIDLHSDDVFSYSSTYCSITCQANGPIAIEHVAKDVVHASHPAYSAFGLESYIGIPIRLENKLYGTLNFSSPTPYARKFSEADIDALCLMGTWIEVELTRQHQANQLKILNHQLKQLANTDSLTNVYNRRGMYKHLAKGLSWLSRQGGGGTLAFLDIDHFKKLNDRYGHQIGDKILVAIAQILEGSLRDYDLVARFGGEEFLLWMPGSDINACRQACTRIMQKISKLDIVIETVTVSVGVCAFTVDEGYIGDSHQVVDSIVGRADKALYRAKTNGRNCIETCSERLLLTSG